MGDDFNRDELDQVSKTQPIIVWDASEHFAYANSAAIAKYGVTPDKLKGVTGAGTNPDGSSNGQFLGTNAARLILPEVIAELMKPEAAKKNLTYFGSLMQQAGVTTVGDLFYGGVNLELEQSLSKSFYDNENAWARIVHVVDGYTLSELYGENAVDKALDDARAEHRPHHLQWRQILCRRCVLKSRDGTAMAGLYQFGEVSRPLHV